jgi:NAD(P)-dependent dehydrogenase (short-subunit alcohol dehydrogenase family)
VKTKNEISSFYMEQQKQVHAHKVLRPDNERVAVIFGAAKPGSIGRAIEDSLRNRGFTTYAPRQEQIDVRSPLVLEDYLELIPADTLICCQGVTHLDWIEDQPSIYIEKVIDSTLTGSILAASRFAAAKMSTPWRKQIVFIGSMAYNHVLNGSAPYCAAKAGLAHFAKCIAWELAPKGFDVFCVNPSNTEGAPMTEDTIKGIMRYRDLPRDEAEAYWGAVLPRAAWLQPGDVAEVVSMLLTNTGGGYMSGSNIDLAGGQR